MLEKEKGWSLRRPPQKESWEETGNLSDHFAGLEQIKRW